MQGANAVLNVVTIPPGATSTQARIVLDGLRGAIFVYAAGPPTSSLVGSWAGQAGTDPYGNIYPEGLSGNLGVLASTTILVYNGTPALGNLIGSWAGQAGTDTFGNVFQLGLFAQQGLLSGVTLNAMCSIVGSSISGSTLQNCTVQSGTISETSIILDTTGGNVLGYATTIVTQSFTSSGSFTTPSFGSPVITIEAWGAGAGGIWGGHFGGGGAGGEYAKDFFSYPASTLINFTIGAHGVGGTSSITATSGGDTNWNSGQVVAHGGQKGNDGNGGKGGTGSGNTVHNDGGNGGTSGSFTNCGGGGGGAAGSRLGTGQAGANNSGVTGVSGGTGAGGAGSGGNSGGTNTPGGAATAPGGGGGGGGNNGGFGSGGGPGGLGADGQIIITYSSANTLFLSVSPVAGTDPLTSTAYPIGLMAQELTLINNSAIPTAPPSGRSAIWGDNLGNAEVQGPSGLSLPISRGAADVSTFTVTQSTATQCTKAWSIPSGDQQVGTVYRLTFTGHGTQGSTAEQLTFQFSNGDAAAVIGSGLAGASQPFFFRVILQIVIVSATTANFFCHGFAGTGFAEGFTQAGSFSTPFTLEGNAKWQATTGAPTLTCTDSVFERIGA